MTTVAVLMGGWSPEREVSLVSGKACALGLRQRGYDVEVIDVRGQSEWEAGHIPGARHLFLGDLMDRARSLPHDRPLVVVCQGGTRSAIAASLLHSLGYSNVLNFSGGLAEWQGAGLPVETDEAPSKLG